jgi:hypothetical protein
MCKSNKQKQKDIFLTAKKYYLDMFLFHWRFILNCLTWKKSKILWNIFFIKWSKMHWRSIPDHVTCVSGILWMIQTLIFVGKGSVHTNQTQLFNNMVIIWWSFS